MLKEFMKGMYQIAVIEHLNYYNDMLQNCEVTKYSTEYWKDAIALYSSLTEKEKSILLRIVRQTSVDAISSVLGIMDNTTFLQNGSFECKLYINKINTEFELQDTFLELVELDEFK